MSSRTVRVLLFVSIALTAVVFQNCSSDSQFSANENFSVLQFMATHDFRKVEIDPQSEEFRPEIELTTIVDNSVSMKPIQDQVVSSFRNVAGRLRGFSGVAKVLSTTQDNSGLRPSFEENRHIEVLEESGARRRVDRLTDVPTERSFIEGQEFRGLETLFAPLSFDRKGSTSQFNQFVSQYSDQVGRVIPSTLEIFGREIADRDLRADQIPQIYGSEREQGLCTILRNLQRERVPGRFYSYIIATDEDDFTEAQFCLSRQERQTNRRARLENASESCQPGDANCVFDYQVGFAPQTRWVARVQTRSVSEQARVRLLNHPSRATFRVNTENHVLNFNFAVQQSQSVLEWEEGRINDGSIFPTGVTRSRTLAPWSDGACASQTPRACSTAEASQATSPVVPGSCRVRCEARNISQARSLAASVGSCAAVGRAISAQTCAANDRGQAATLYRAGMSPETLSECSVTCTNSTISNTRNVNIMGSCAQAQFESATPQSRACSSEELLTYFQINQVAAGQSCVASCARNADTNVGLSLQQSRCEGVSETANGSRAQACSERTGVLSELQRLRGWAPSAIDTCTYSCSQSLATQSRTLEENAGCNAGETRACGQEELSLFQGLYGDRLVASSCQVRCESNGITPPVHRAQAQSSPGLCQPGSSFLQEAQSRNPAWVLNPSSCRLENGRRTNSRQIFVSETLPQAVQSLIPDNRGKVEWTAEQLRTTYGRQFFLAAFINTGQDSRCVADLNEPNRITSRQVGTTYLELIRELGAGNARAFSVCAADYSPALDAIFETILSQIKESYNLKLNTERGEFVHAVRARLKGSSEYVEVDPAKFEISEGVIRFSDSNFLKQIEKFEVEIGYPKF